LGFDPFSVIKVSKRKKKKKQILPEDLKDLTGFHKEWISMGMGDFFWESSNSPK